MGNKVRMNLSLLALGVLLTLDFGLGSIVKGTNKAVQCGGTLQSDNGSLIFPQAGETIIPGEVCIWTIHLDTMESFNFDFTDLSVSSGTSDCSKAGVRLYSLSNLVTGDNQESSYTFCNEQPPNDMDSILVSQMVATVVFYTSEDTLINLDTGFTLNWQGVSTDPLRTAHEPNSLTNSSATLKYPAMGQGYKSNLAATWLVSTDGPVDINLESLNLESCANTSNTCFCDALVLYEVSPQGVLSERQRFCKNVSNELTVREVSSKFILGFFTDLQDEPGSTGGFNLTYHPSIIQSTTTVATTLDPTASTEYPFPVVKLCGEILTGSRGKISYKANHTYDSMERCIFTIRSPESTQLTFTLTKSDLIEDDIDSILISTFSSNAVYSNISNEVIHQTAQLQFLGSSVTLDGTVAVIMFVSDYSDEEDSTQLGFELEFFGNDVSGDISTASQDFIFIETSGSVSFPSDDSLYSNNLVSTFAFPSPNGKQEVLSRLNLQIKSKMVPAMELCNDQFRIYSFKFYEQGFEYYDTVCLEDVNNGAIYSYNETFVTLVVFFSDAQNGGYGVDMTWNWEISDSALLN